MNDKYTWPFPPALSKIPVADVYRDEEVPPTEKDLEPLPDTERDPQRYFRPL